MGNPDVSETVSSTQKPDSGEGFRIAIIVCDLALLGVSLWSLAVWSQVLDFILTLGSGTIQDYFKSYSGVVIAIHAFLSLLLLISLWGICYRKRKIVFLNWIVYIVYAVLVIISGILNFLNLDLIGGGVSVAFSVFAVMSAVLCKKYYNRLVQTDAAVGPMEQV